jgi:hypothetical protein
VPVDVAMKEPRPRVVSEESDCDIISRLADAHDVSDDGVFIVVGRAVSAADDGERVPVQVDRVLQKNSQGRNCSDSTVACTLTGPPGAPAGMVISTLLLEPRP